MIWGAPGVWNICITAPLTLRSFVVIHLFFVRLPEVMDIIYYTLQLTSVPCGVLKGDWFNKTLFSMNILSYLYLSGALFTSCPSSSFHPSQHELLEALIKNSIHILKLFGGTHT